MNFTEQTPDYRDLRTSSGYDEVQTDDGVGFIGWGFNDYKPTIDLKSAIVDISELVASDSYQPSQVEVTTELPDVWLGGRNTATESDAQTLYQSAQAAKSPNHCKLALVRSRLFCLVVARSFVDGVDGYETNESLTRLSDGLGAILERHAGLDEAK